MVEFTERRVARLLHRCSHDDLTAMSELVEVTGAGMLHTARRASSSEDDATEAVVAAYVEVWERAQRREDFGPSPVLTMHAIAHRLARDLTRPHLAAAPDLPA